MATSTEKMLRVRSQETYRLARQTIFNDLRLLYDNLLVLQAIKQYRTILDSHFSPEFLNALADACFSSGIMIVCRIWDNKSMRNRENFSFEYLYDHIQESLLKKSESRWKKQFNDIAPKDKQKEISLKQARATRDKHIAHSDVGVHVREAQNGTAPVGKGEQAEAEQEKTRLALLEFKLEALYKPAKESMAYFEKFEPDLHMPIKDRQVIASVTDMFDALALRTAMVRLHKSDPERWKEKCGEYADTNVEKLIKAIHKRNQ